MNIHASIYSSKKSVKDTIKMLDSNSIDSIHVDALVFNEKVKKDILFINKKIKKEIDLHIVNYNDIKNIVDFINTATINKVYLQYENLVKEADVIFLKNNVKDKKVKVFPAVQVKTQLSQVEKLVENYEGLLLMTTQPGISGLSFDEKCYSWLYEFKNKYPNKELFVDGGVNDKVFKSLLQYNVSGVISGSYLFKQKNIEDAILKMRNV